MWSVIGCKQPQIWKLTTLAFRLGKPVIVSRRSKACRIHHVSKSHFFQKYPNSRITGLSNSATQKAHIDAVAIKKSLHNLKVHEQTSVMMPALTYN